MRIMSKIGASPGSHSSTAPGTFTPEPAEGFAPRTVEAHDPGRLAWKGCASIRPDHKPSTSVPIEHFESQPFAQIHLRLAIVLSIRLILDHIEL